MRYPFNYDAIPDHMQAALLRYVNKGSPVGDFLSSIIKNDLQGACSNADDTNLPLIPVYIAWLYNKAPGRCYGSPEIMRAWIEKGGLAGGGVAIYDDFLR